MDVMPLYVIESRSSPEAPWLVREILMDEDHARAIAPRVAQEIANMWRKLHNVDAPALEVRVSHWTAKRNVRAVARDVPDAH